MAKDLSRRDFFRRFIPGKQGKGNSEESFYESAAPFEVAGENSVAVIQGKYCLAYEDIPCTTCHDRCPVEGAIVVEDGLPMVEPAVCTGCRVCKEVCPAPSEAILMVPAKRSADPTD
jgi:Na+-translocating ferredoxin:NAD+ oxidoreductase RNF subunit RnfB